MRRFMEKPVPDIYIRKSFGNITDWFIADYLVVEIMDDKRCRLIEHPDKLLVEYKKDVVAAKNWHQWKRYKFWLAHRLREIRLLHPLQKNIYSAMGSASVLLDMKLKEVVARFGIAEQYKDLFKWIETPTKTSVSLLERIGRAQGLFGKRMRAFRGLALRERTLKTLLKLGHYYELSPSSWTHDVDVAYHFAEGATTVGRYSVVLSADIRVLADLSFIPNSEWEVVSMPRKYKIEKVIESNDVIYMKLKLQERR